MWNSPGVCKLGAKLVMITFIHTISNRVNSLWGQKGRDGADPDWDSIIGVGRLYMFPIAALPSLDCGTCPCYLHWGQIPHWTIAAGKKPTFPPMTSSQSRKSHTHTPVIWFSKASHSITRCMNGFWSTLDLEIISYNTWDIYHSFMVSEWCEYGEINRDAKEILCTVWVIPLVGDIHMLKAATWNRTSRNFYKNYPIWQT